MILIITAKRDSHIGAVAQHFDEVGVPWVRLNTEDFATNVDLTISPTAGNGTLRVRDSDKTINLDEVGAVWYRKPDPVSTTHFSNLEPAALEYIDAELGELLLNLYSLLQHIPWINNPFTTRIAHRKMLQLKTAASIGFRTPRTIITNNPETALAFAESLPSDVAVKSLGAITVTAPTGGGEAIQYGLFTRRVTLPELRTVKDTIRHLPTAFQEFIEKQYELRITVVGSRIFACRIESRGDDLTADDYRLDTTRLRHTLHECPELEEKLLSYMRAFGITFGCFDIIVTKAGDPVFVECNVNGQWQWIQNMTGLPIGSAIAQELLAAHTQHLGARKR